jgi:hypothetical protein
MRMIRAVFLRRRPGLLEQPDVFLVLVFDVGLATLVKAPDGDSPAWCFIDLLKARRRRESIKGQQSLSIGGLWRGLKLHTYMRYNDMVGTFEDTLEFITRRSRTLH